LSASFSAYSSPTTDPLSSLEESSREESSLSGTLGSCSGKLILLEANNQTHVLNSLFISKLGIRRLTHMKTHEAG